MILKTEKKTIELRPTTRKIVKMTEENGCKNLNEYFFKVLNDHDIKGLATIIYNFAEVENKNAFNNVHEVYDFIDAYRAENNKTYDDITKEIGEFINDMGFFNVKMTKEEFQKTMEDPFSSFNMKKIINDSTEKAITEVVAEEFRGYKA